MNPRAIAELVVKWRRRADELAAIADEPDQEPVRAVTLRNVAMHIGRCAQELEDAATKETDDHG